MLISEILTDLKTYVVYSCYTSMVLWIVCKSCRFNFFQIE